MHAPSAHKICRLGSHSSASALRTPSRRAVKEKQKSEAAVAELRGQGDAELDSLRSEVAAAEHRAVEAQAATERVESELRDYKVCASGGH